MSPGLGGPYLELSHRLSSLKQRRQVNLNFDRPRQPNSFACDGDTPLRLDGCTVGGTPLIAPKVTRMMIERDRRRGSEPRCRPTPPLRLQRLLLRDLDAPERYRC